MKIIEIINEARKNPHLNPKLSVYDQLKARYDSTTDYIDADTKNLFANFFGFEKIGVYPDPDKKGYTTTPIGVYAYPVDYVLKRIEASQLIVPYRSDKPFINLFNVNKSSIMHIDEYPRSQQYLDQMAEVYAREVRISIEQAKQTINDVIASRFMEDDPPSVYSDVKLLTKWVFNEDLWRIDYRSRLTALLKRLGFDGVYDPGYGQIHKNEPVQLVVFNPNSIKNNQRIINKKYTDRSEYGQQQHQTIQMFKQALVTKNYDAISDILTKFYAPKLVSLISDPQIRQQVIKEFVNSINHLKNPTDQEQLLAVQSHPKQLITHHGLKIPNKQLMPLAIESLPIENIVIEEVYQDNLTKDDMVALVKKKPKLIFKLYDFDWDLAELAISLGTDPKRTRIQAVGMDEETILENIETSEMMIKEFQEDIEILKEKIANGVESKAKPYDFESQIDYNMKEISRYESEIKQLKKYLNYINS